MNTAKPSFAVVVCGLAACSVYEDTLGKSAPDGGAGTSSQASSGSSTTGAGTGSSSTTAGSGSGGSHSAGVGGAAGSFDGGGTTGGGSGTSGGGTGTATGGTSGAGGSAGIAGGANAGGAGSTAAGGAAGGKAGAGGSASTGMGGAGGGAAGVGGGAGGVGGAGGAGGSGGAAGSGSSVDAGPGICNYANPITLLYRHWPTEAGASLLDFSFKLVNGSTQAIQLNTITARYYLTNEIAMPLLRVTYGDVCCPDKIITSSVTATLQPMNPPAAGADTYIEFGFAPTAGSLAPAHTIEVEVELSNATGSMSNPSNDYSHIAAATGTQSQWDNCPGTGNCMPFRSCLVTVYQSGTLVWGNPPQ